jgi:V/A-type H+-transporting ATPase subunit C
MTGYEYGNARLHAMKSRLLSRKELETLVAAGSLQGLIAALTKTIYQKSVETALARTTGMECIAESLHGELIGTLGKISSFYHGIPGSMVSIVLRSYDVHNLKAILRGLSRNAPAGEIIKTFLPIGELSYDSLVELASTGDPRSAIDVIASLRLPFAQPLLQLRAEHPGAEEFEMELALDKWYIQESRRTLKSKARGRDQLSAALDLEADLANLLTVLRFAHTPSEHSFLNERIGSDDLTQLFLGPGKLEFALLAQAGTQDTVEAAISTLAESPYGITLKKGLEMYAHSAHLSSIEKCLKRFRLEWMNALIPKDPLGIGVVLGYIAVKINEVNNIRWIAQGINIGLKTETIRLEVEFIP